MHFYKNTPISIAYDFKKGKWYLKDISRLKEAYLKHNEDLNYTDIDLSEKHLAYYNVHKAEGKSQHSEGQLLIIILEKWQSGQERDNKLCHVDELLALHSQTVGK